MSANCTKIVLTRASHIATIRDEGGQLNEPVLGRSARASDATSLAERTLEAVKVFANARCAALFVREQEVASLFASRDIDQAALTTVAKTWANCRDALSQGQLIIESGPQSSSALVPILDDDRLTGVLYVRTDEERFADDRDLNALVQFAGIAAIALAVPVDLPIPRGGVELYLERTAATDVARKQLLVLLERNEWNIARVARLMGVTRPTIYNRLERFGIERRHVPKITAPKREPA